MSDVRDTDSSNLQPDRGCSLDSSVSAVQLPGAGTNEVESIVISSPSTPQVGSKERNKMFMITGCSGLFLSNALALLEVIWGFYNTTMELPPVHLPEWAVGFIFFTYGSAVIVWLQNKIEKAAIRKEGIK